MSASLRLYLKKYGMKKGDGSKYIEHKKILKITENINQDR